MKICIISDMHCKHKIDPKENADTLLISNDPRVPANRHPVSSILSLIEKEKIDADILVCPGDLGDKADQQGITSSWGFLDEIQRKLKSRLLIGIPGNHDINSRAEKPEEVFEFIKTFHEKFPLEDEALKTSFWENGFCNFQFEEIQFFLLNSVHDHINPVKASESGISKTMCEKIKKYLKEFKVSGKVKYKIAILHHHPIPHSNIKNWNKDTDLLRLGDEFIDILNLNDFQILIHGHKHQPRIVEYNSLPIFAAGSFASIANLQASGFNTMFHMLELNENEKKGIIYSWEFDLVYGWKQRLNEHFPPKIGFGSAKSVETIAESINSIFIRNGSKSMLYDDIADEEKETQYLIPEKLKKLNFLLQDKYGIKMTPEFPLEPNKVSQLIK